MQRTVSYLQSKLIVSAITESAKIQASGSGSFDQTNSTLKALKGILFPEFEEDQKAHAARTKKLLEREFNRGPMKVKALDYGGKKRKKRG